MTTIYIEEITDDDPRPRRANGSSIEQLAPVTDPTCATSSRRRSGQERAAATFGWRGNAGTLAEAAKKRGNAAFAAKNSVEAIAAYTEIRLDGGNGGCSEGTPTRRPRPAPSTQQPRGGARPSTPRRWWICCRRWRRRHFRLGNAPAWLRPAPSRRRPATSRRSAAHAANDARRRGAAQRRRAQDRMLTHASLRSVRLQAGDAPSASRGGGDVVAARPSVERGRGRRGRGASQARRRDAHRARRTAQRAPVAPTATALVHDDVWDVCPENGWRRSRPRVASSSARSGHAAAAVGAAALVVFGGQRVGQAVRRRPPPDGRRRGSAVGGGGGERAGARRAQRPLAELVRRAGGGGGGSLWMFGGADDEGHALSELWRLTAPRRGGAGVAEAGVHGRGAGGARDARGGGAGARGALVVHGGNGGAGPLDTLHLLDLATLVGGARHDAVARALAHAAALLAPAARAAARRLLRRRAAARSTMTCGRSRTAPRGGGEGQVGRATRRQRRPRRAPPRSAPRSTSSAARARRRSSPTGCTRERWS